MDTFPGRDNDSEVPPSSALAPFAPKGEARPDGSAPAPYPPTYAEVPEHGEDWPPKDSLAFRVMQDLYEAGARDQATMAFPADIAQRLGVPQEEVQAALDELRARDLIAQEEDDGTQAALDDLEARGLIEKRWNGTEHEYRLRLDRVDEARALLSAPPPPEPVVRWCLKGRHTGKVHLSPSFEHEQEAWDHLRGVARGDQPGIDLSDGYTVARLEIREKPE